ncbi:hypothetical protein KH172YL63_19810 [Bacillus sp. KH172YL63]|nr:hypothetical protein KH172YL63_19810 [Bacillus sp. KH172YL63]
MCRTPFSNISLHNKIIVTTLPSPVLSYKNGFKEARSVENEKMGICFGF